ncbi:hypothetical protein ACWFRF_05035 [Nocardia sp. NPDC055165]
MTLRHTLIGALSTALLVCPGLLTVLPARAGMSRSTGRSAAASTETPQF